MFPWQKTNVKTRALREDRILQEIHATGGDIRRICDLFDLKVDTAMRYAATLGHPDLANQASSRMRPLPSRGEPREGSGVASDVNLWFAMPSRTLHAPNTGRGDGMPTDTNSVGPGDGGAIQGPAGEPTELPGSQGGLRIGSVVIMCNDFRGTLAFWQEALRYDPPRQPGGPGFAILGDPAGTAPNVSVQETDVLKFGRNRMHLDLYADDQRSEVERLLRLGASIHDAPGGGKDYVIMADPEGKLFCVVGLDRSKYWSP